MGYTPPSLEVRKITGGWAIYPPTTTTGDDLTIYPNLTDTTARIKFDGNNALYLIHNSANFCQFGIDVAGTGYIRVSYGATAETIESIINNADLYLKTAGSGVIQFGTYTAGAATDSTGYISIKDAGGTTRKLMVQA